jgi:hypothetical protein
LGVNVGTPEIGAQPNSYNGEILKFKAWISERLEWLDANMPGNCPNVGEKEKKISYVVTYPNPSTEILNLYSEQKIKHLEFYNALGKMIFRKNNINSNNFQKNVDSFKGFYVIKITLYNNIVVKKSIISY